MSKKCSQRRFCDKTWPADFVARPNAAFAKELRCLPEIGFSSGISTLTKNTTFTSPVKLTIVNTSSTTTISNDILCKFMDEYKSFNIDLKENERSMWLANMNVKLKLSINLDK